MNKKIIKAVSLMLASVMAVGIFTSCRGRDRSRDNDRVQELNEPVKNVTLLKDTSFIEEKMTGLKDIKSVEYEGIVFTSATRMEIGPHEARYRGIVYLTEDEAERLMSEYEWEECDAPEFEFDEVDTSGLGEGPWYRSDDFKSSCFTTYNIHYIVFDGEKIVFDVQQT